MIYILTGNGKGKTTAAFGIALRALGHNQKALVIQFIKENLSGEVKFLQNNSNITIRTCGSGFVGILNDKKNINIHRKNACQALEIAKKEILTNKFDLVILDEINVALDLKLIDLNQVIDLIKNKPKNLHIVLTGRNAPHKLIELADMVSEIKNIKHPFDTGLPAQKGVDY